MILGLLGALTLSIGITLLMDSLLVALLTGIGLWLTLSSILFLLQDIKKGRGHNN